VLRRNFPDPSVLQADGCYFAYATGHNNHVQVAVSRDLRTWSAPREAMPERPAWAHAEWPDVWAPEALYVNGRYVLYFSARHVTARVPDAGGGAEGRGSFRPCLGVAESRFPGGPFTPLPEPLLCTAFGEGAIDPSPFRDADGRLYLYFKRDGNCCHRSSKTKARRPAEIYAQALDPSGLRLVGEMTWLGVEDAGVDEQWPGWPGEVVEAPTMVRRGDAYLLFYSGNWFTDERYAVGFAWCRTALGPCREYEGNPVLKSDRRERPILDGPGHPALIEREGRTWMLYHARDARTRWCRTMHLAEVTWSVDASGAPIPRVLPALPDPARACEPEP